MLFIIAVHNYTIAMNCCQGYYLSIYNVTANALTYFSIMEENYFVIWTLQFLNFFAFPAQRDELLRLWESERRYFNPLSRHGERPVATVQSGDTVKFQTTLPAKGETLWSKDPRNAAGFQPTLPTQGETPPVLCRRTTSQDFNPLFQQRERLRLQEQIKALQVISTHSPSKGRDPDRLIPTILQFKFQPTLPAKGETAKVANNPLLLLYILLK